MPVQRKETYCFIGLFEIMLNFFQEIFFYGLKQFKGLKGDKGYKKTTGRPLLFDRPAILLYSNIKYYFVNVTFDL